MNIAFDPKEVDMIGCQEAYNELDPESALLYNHYELAKYTTVPVELWKQFLTDSRVSDWIDSELQLYRKTQLNKLIAKSTTDSKSVGTSAMINALQKGLDTGKTGDDAITIYAYIPVNSKQREANNVVELTEDIFWEED